MSQIIQVYRFLAKGGPTMIPIAGCSIVAVAIIAQKILLFYKMRFMSEETITAIKNAINSGDVDSASKSAEKSGTFLGDVLAVCLKKTCGAAIKEAVDRAISKRVNSLERYLSTLGTIVVIAPFLGLLGTVTGIMRAFHDMSKYNVNNPFVIYSGLYEALLTTASGLVIAIPSVVFYNYFLKKIYRTASDVEYNALEILSPLIHR
ncbi:MAG: Biopolymer transport protein ExbB [Elusimicrobia bacterium ADurb.Bin231]|nr:MAG: Biopolymer transport protein ExbB [Elusimicrobia bacterium ADurb.Bin231]